VSPDRKLLALVFGTALFASYACYLGGSKPTPPPPDVVISSNDRLKFKGGERMATDLAAGLSLSRSDVCKELGAYDCVTDVHGIALGGIEPYRKTIYRPIPERSVASVDAADRIALSACDQRAQRDFASPGSAVVFGELAQPGAGAAAVKPVANRLYVDLLHRDANADELAALDELWTQISADAPTDGARRFATLACFAVATTEEALFY
jgi:hypothetical protein